MIYPLLAEIDQFLTAESQLLQATPTLAYSATWRGEALSCELCDTITEEYLDHPGVYPESM